ncbi:CCAAT/enhancer-binding protein zeta-like [Histomonas meleagridis]|uniref:CCAAT/enhancer-binding protein zeta-like n=1 Tax=Histomonas meleagridis TaxID=135588 RepID=UPI003559D51A|nr:CCAAT/enhancer-binding protein zeta-like [Histomonas meleagridis]KAH0796687.1 CCAAT/enhancer-binding protein zeta-like [Histomonas meleagridis]
MKIQQGDPWYQLLYYNKNIQSKSSGLPRQEINKLLNKSKEIYQQYVNSTSVDEITESILKSGTLKDKLSAYKVFAQDYPVLSLENLKQLNEMLGGKPRVAIDAMHCAMDIYIKTLLPDRPLKKFDDQPLKNAKDFHLLIFYFEDQLKIVYSQFIKAVEKLANSIQQFVREPSIRVIGELLRKKPENERILLNILVYKFGDPLKQVASVATSTILSILRDHPHMNHAIITAIKDQQSNFPKESQKRALNFIGQLSLNSDDQSTATDLLNTIKPQILKILESNDESNSKVLKSLMRSAQKCAQVCSPEEMSPLVTPLYEHIQNAPIGIALPSLGLLYTIHRQANKVPKEFYEYFYRALLSPEFSTSSKLPHFLNLLIEALTNEKNDEIISAFIHRLLHVGLEANVSVSAAVLVFTSKMFESKKRIGEMFSVSNIEADHKYVFDGDKPDEAGALQTFPWILSLYMKHYCPAIRELAKRIVSQQEINYETDPFFDMSTMNLLAHIADGENIQNEIVAESFREFDEIPEFIDEDEDKVVKIKEKEKRKNNKQNNKQKQQQNNKQKQKQQQKQSNNRKQQKPKNKQKKNKQKQKINK